MSSHDEIVPVTSDFAEIYPQDATETQKGRWQNLLTKFEETYGKKADFVARSPGRVNLIGEVSRFDCLQLMCVCFEETWARRGAWMVSSPEVWRWK